MAQVNIISCDGCGNIILPGDIIAITTKGVFVGNGQSLDIQEVEGSKPVHFCDACSNETAATMRELIEEAAARDTPTEECPEPKDCLGMGCNNCVPFMK